MTLLANGAVSESTDDDDDDDDDEQEDDADDDDDAAISASISPAAFVTKFPPMENPMVTIFVFGYFSPICRIIARNSDVAPQLKMRGAVSVSFRSAPRWFCTATR